VSNKVRIETNLSLCLHIKSSITDKNQAINKLIMNGYENICGHSLKTSWKNLINVLA
jgi:hypothetical protein